VHIQNQTLSQGSAIVPITVQGSSTVYTFGTLFSFCINAPLAAMTASASASFSTQAAAGTLILATTSNNIATICSGVCYGDGGSGSVASTPAGGGGGSGAAAIGYFGLVVAVLAALLL
jgi:hypothetical protein